MPGGQHCGACVTETRPGIRQREQEGTTLESDKLHFHPGHGSTPAQMTTECAKGQKVTQCSREPALSLHDVPVIVVRQPPLSGSVLSVLIGRGEAGGESTGRPRRGSAFLQRTK